MLEVLKRGRTACLSYCCEKNILGTNHIKITISTINDQLINLLQLRIHTQNFQSIIKGPLVCQIIEMMC